MAPLPLFAAPGLDRRDLKLLSALDRNSREPLTSLAKRIRLSKQATHRRLALLLQSGRVQRLYPIVNYSRIGFTQYKLYLNLRPTAEEQYRSLIDALLAIKGVIWVADCRGTRDLAVTILASSLNAFTSIYDLIAATHGHQILNKDICVVQTSTLYTRAYLAGEEKRSFSYLSPSERKDIDATDMRILQVLSEDGRASLLALSSSLGMSRTALQHRLKRLENGGIILGYRALFGLRKLGVSLYKVIIKLNRIERLILSRLEAFTLQHPCGVQFLRIVGNTDVELEFEVPSEDVFYIILLDLRREFSDVMHSYETLLITKEHDIRFFFV